VANASRALHDAPRHLEARDGQPREAADAYLTKPFQVEELTTQVDDLTARRRRPSAVRT
jgi:CheY-like chemotaxis protein